MKNAILLAVLLVFALPSGGRADTVLRAYKKLKKNELPKAKQLTDKSLAKNPQNAGAWFIQALYTLQDTTAQHCLDSAYAYTLTAHTLFPQTPAKSQKRWNKAGLNAQAIWQTKLVIDSMAFVRARQMHSVPGYQYFMDHFPTAAQTGQARDLRNLLAFARAEREDTYQSYKAFLDAYPDASQAAQAKERYDVLLFEKQTAGGDIRSFETFIREHPGSPFRKEAERHIFEMFTAPHTREIYREFIQRYPDSRYTQRAWQWIFFLHKKTEPPRPDFLQEYPDFYDKEYARQLMAAEKRVYFPVYEEEKYGFVDASGILQIPIRYDSMPGQYFCEGVKEDFILIYQDDQIIALDKTGRQIIEPGFSHIEQLDEGLLLVRKNDRLGVYHQSGFPVVPPRYDEIELLDDVFLLVRQGEKLGLVTLNGRKVTAVAYDDIRSLDGSYLVFEKDRKLALITHEQLFRAGDEGLSFIYDEVEWVKKGFVKVESDGRHGILSSQLQPVIPLIAAEINPTPAGWTVSNQGFLQIYRANGQLLTDSVFTEVIGNAAFYAVKKNERWSVISTDGHWYGTMEFDAITLLAETLFVGQLKNNQYVSVGGGKMVPIGDYARVRPQKLPNDSQQIWLLVENKAGKKGLFNARAEKVLAALYDDIQVWEPDVIHVQQRGKHGVVNAQGKTMIATNYDGLHYQENQGVAILKNGKFGLINLKSGAIIQPVSEVLLKKYDPKGTVFIGRKGGKYGLISSAAQPVSEFTFDEIRFWQLGVALVKQADLWYLYDIAEKRFVFKPIEHLSYIREDEEEIILKIYENKMYGVLSNTQGQLIACEYNDLENVGSATQPLYLAQKYIQNADVYLVYYIDRDGNQMRRQLFNPDKYNRIVCE